jgi:hypothetical protein
MVPRRTVTADTGHLSGAHQAADRLKTSGTAGSLGETRAMSGLSAAGRSDREAGSRAPGDASRAHVRCYPGALGSPHATASSLQSAARASWLRDPRPQYLRAGRGERPVLRVVGPTSAGDLSRISRITIECLLRRNAGVDSRDPADSKALRDGHLQARRRPRAVVPARCAAGSRLEKIGRRGRR